MDLNKVLTGTGETGTGQNLVNPTHIHTAERSGGFYKSIILDVLSVGFALVFGYLYHRYLIAGISVWFLVVTLALFGMFSVLQALLAKDTLRRFIIIVLEAAAFLIFFNGDDWRVLVLTAAILIIFFSWGYFSSRSRLDNSIEIPFFGISGNVLGKLTTAALLFMVLIYVPRIDGSDTFISQQSFRTLFNWASGFVQSLYPTVNVNASSTFAQFTDSLAATELANNDSFKSSSPSSQSATLAQQSTDLQSAFSKNLSAPIDPNESTGDAFYQIVNGLLAGVKARSSRWFLFGWAVVVFVALRAVGVVFVWVAQFVTLVFYEALLIGGFMKISNENQTKEVIGF